MLDSDDTKAGLAKRRKENKVQKDLEAQIAKHKENMRQMEKEVRSDCWSELNVGN